MAATWVLRPSATPSADLWWNLYKDGKVAGVNLFLSQALKHIKEEERRG